MVDIFDEVAEDLRAERASRLARRYGGVFVAIAILVLLGVAADQVWDWYQQRQNNAAASTYLALSQQIQAQGAGISNAQRVSFAGAEQKFAANAPEGYRTLAELQAAALYATAGQPAQAEAQWTQLADDTHADPLLRDLATLLWAQHALGTLPDAAVAARLTPLTASKNPYHGLAQETQALMLIGEGKTAQAKGVLSELISDPSVPQGVSNRAQALLAKLNGN